MADASLLNLAGLAQAIIQEINHGQIEKQKLDNEYDSKVLNEESKHIKRMTHGLFGLATITLGIAGMLFGFGRDQSALDFIKIVAAVGGAFIGGLSWTAYRRTNDEE